MDIRPGTELPPLVRKTGFPHWNRYAAVNDEFVPIHMDDGAGQAAGFPTAIGMGNLIWAYCHRLLRGWMTSAGRIERISLEYRLPNLRESTLHVHARVAEVSRVGATQRVVLDLWADDDADRRLATGQAVVVVATA